MQPSLERRRAPRIDMTQYTRAIVHSPGVVHAMEPRPPATEFVYEAVVEVAPRQDMGRSPLGERFIVPITGGRFEGPRLRGRVLPGGADRQLLRADAVKLLDALYEMQTDDGVLLTVHNQVLIDDPPAGPRYAFSHVRVTAPEGPYAWLNRRVFVGTLQALMPQLPAVRIRVYQLV